jgi:O-antigen ligase
MSNSIAKNAELLSTILIGILPLGLIIGTAVSESVIIIINICFLVIFFARNDYSIIKIKEIFYLTIIWLYLLINCLAANDSSVAFNRSFFFFKYIILVLSVSLIFKNIYYKKIIFFSWSIIVSVVAIDIYFEFFFGKNLLGYVSADRTRIVSFMKDELRIGSLMLAFLFFVINFWNLTLTKNKISLKIKYIIYLIEILFLTSIFLTGERVTGLKTLLCCFIAMFLFKSQYKIFKIFLILIIPLTLFFTSSNIKDRYRTAYFDLIEKDKIFYNSLHAAHYDTALSIFKEYPLLGVGNKNFRIECAKEKYAKSKFGKTLGRCSTHPHQIYLEILSELGLIGFILIFSFIFINIYKGIKIFLKIKDLILLSSILYLLSSLVPLLPSGSFFSSFNATIFWINFSIMLSFIINRKTQINNTKII